MQTNEYFCAQDMINKAMENERKSNKIEIDKQRETTKELLKDFGITAERSLVCGKNSSDMGKI